MENNPTQAESTPHISDPITRPHLVKEQSAYIPGQDSAVSPNVLDHVDARAHADSSPFSSLGSGSGSSNKLPQLSSGNDTTLVSESNTQSPDPIDIAPKIIVPPDELPLPASAPLVPEPPAESKPSVAPQDRPAPTTSSSSPSSDSEGHVGPTRASIRAWAKATPAGAPRDTPSPHTSAVNSSGSDDSGSRVSLTRTASHIVGLPHIQRGGDPSSGSRFEDPSLSKMAQQAETEESSGNIADGESSGSEPACMSPPNPSPVSSPPPGGHDRVANRELLAPHPHPHEQNSHTRPQSHHVHHPHPHSHLHSHPQAHPQAHPHPHPQAQTHPRSHPHPHPHVPPPHSTSSSASPPREPEAEHQSSNHQEQQERRDRRSHRHPPSGRRRHRDRERDRDRDRDRDRRPPTAVPVLNAYTSTYALPPLRPLPPPPAPLLRAGTPRAPAGDMDVLDEITKMLALSSTPLLRRGGGVDVGMGGDGWVPLRVPRENDVLDDIYKMIMWSRGV